MTNIEAMKLALDALEAMNPYPASKEDQRNTAIAALRQAISEAGQAEPQHSTHYWQHEVNNARADGYERGYKAGKEQPAEQEPVAWANPHGGFLSDRYIKTHSTGLERETHTIPLYTAPTQREWVGLTEEDVEAYEIMGGKSDAMLARAIEAKLKEKNCD